MKGGENVARAVDEKARLPDGMAAAGAEADNSAGRSEIPVRLMEGL